MTESAPHEAISYRRVVDIVEGLLERHLTYDDVGVPEGVEHELTRQEKDQTIDEKLLVIAFRYHLSSLVSLVGRDFGFLREIVRSCEKCVTADVNLALFGVEKDNKELALMALDLLEHEPPRESEEKAGRWNLKQISSWTLQSLKRLLEWK